MIRIEFENTGGGDVGVVVWKVRNEMKNLPNKHDHEGSYIVLFLGRGFEHQANELPIQPPVFKNKEKETKRFPTRMAAIGVCGRDRKGDPF